jgi:hypothetical protein
LGYGAVEDLLVNLLLALKEESLPMNSINAYASAVSHIAQSSQTLTFGDELKLSSLISELASDPELPRNTIKVKNTSEKIYMFTRN